MTTETKRYPAVMRAVFCHPWAIRPEMMAIVCEVVARRIDGDDIEDKPDRAAISARLSARPFTRQSDTAVVPVQGVIVHHGNMVDETSGPMTSVDTVFAQFSSAFADDSIKRIVLDVDSPGGSVDGVPELADVIMAARGTKPIIAVANSLMASAAFWIGAAADEVVVTPSAQIGSVGVVAQHIDFTEMDKMGGMERTLVSAGEFKTEFDGPLTDDALAELQSEVDRIHTMFVQSLARGRGVTPSRVRSDFGRGRVVGAPLAVESGMADRIATLDQVLGGGTSKRRGGMSRARVETERRRVALRKRKAVQGG